jgi:hypothetical protein
MLDNPWKVCEDSLMNTTCDACHVYSTHTLGTLCADCEAAAFAPSDPFKIELNWIDENFERIERETRDHYWMGV